MSAASTRCSDKMNDGDSLCKPCQTNLRAIAKTSISLARSTRDGVFIADLGPENGSWSTSTCKFCRLLYSVRVGNRKIKNDRIIPSYELRIFSFLQNYDGIRGEKIDRHCTLKDSINLAVIPASFGIHLSRQVLKNHLWTNGHIFCGNTTEKKSAQISGSIVPRHFNPQIVLHWFNYCNRHHKKLCHATVEVPNLKLIDCHDRSIILAPHCATYVAVSYVWAQSKDVSLNSDISQKQSQDSFSLPKDLPKDLPKVIEDAIQVTKELGFRYIWADKYCIDQNSADDMHDQIGQMDLIYRGSEVTIIAAAGDEKIGLPGLGTIGRTPQPVVSMENITAISTMPHPHHTIKSSTWMTRGWTFQESILSRRRLVFTQDQVYFECNGMNCFESLSVPLDLVHTKKRDRFYSFMRSGLFNGRDEGLSYPIFGLPFGSFDDRSQSWSYHMKKYLILATNFTSRKLKFDSDSLKAFAGIMRHLETAKFPIHQVGGIPYLLPSVFPDDRYLDSIIAALCWRHIKCCWSRRSGDGTIKRRDAFPSWTWAGWAGAISWTDLFTDEEMDLLSFVHNFQCEIKDGTLIGLHEYCRQEGSGYLHIPCALRFSAWVVPPNMISLVQSDGIPSWRIESFELELHISEFAGSPVEFIEALGRGRLEFIFVAKGLYNSYFLVVERAAHETWARVLSKRESVLERLYSMMMG